MSMNTRRRLGPLVGTLLILLLASETSVRAGERAPPLLGTWRDVTSRDRFIRFDGRTMARVEGGGLVEVVRVARQEGERVVLDQPIWPRDVGVVVEGRHLTVVDEHAGGTRKYRRVADAGDRFVVKPFPLAEAREVAPSRVKDIAAELARRMTHGQEVRMRKPPEPGAAAQVAAANTLWLKGIVREVGWIDDARFGPASAYAARMIVQHSLDYGLMASVLAWVEAQSSPDFQLKFWHALMRDRFQIMLGDRQRYGTQGGKLADGRVVVWPIEDLAAADRFWREMGMETGLAAYLGTPDLSTVDVLEYAH